MARDRVERRKYQRYETEAKVLFRVNYELKTKVKFRVVEAGAAPDEKYPGLSRNISVEGILFGSDKKLAPGTLLDLEVYLPGEDKPLLMTGEVRWSKEPVENPANGYKFDTGVLLLKVDGEPVGASVHFDKEHGVYWSKALEAVFGTFRKLMQEQKRKPV